MRFLLDPQRKLYESSLGIFLSIELYSPKRLEYANLFCNVCDVKN